MRWGCTSLIIIVALLVPPGLGLALKNVHNLSLGGSRMMRGGYSGGRYSINCYYCNIFLGGGGQAGSGWGSNEGGGTTEVLNGQDAMQGQFPYVVRVVAGASTCGGTIYNQQYIITAGHCVYDKVNKIMRGDIEIYAGSVDRYADNPKGQVVHASVKDVCMHARYANGEVGTDMAIIRLPGRKLVFNQNVREASIHWGEETNFGPKGTIIGWGRMLTPNGTATTSDFETQQWATVNVYGDATKCGNPRNDNLICAGTRQEDVGTAPDGKPTGPCSGDSGGPLTCEVDGQPYDICGVASFIADPCETVNKRGVRAFYTKMGPYLQFFEQFRDSDGGNRRLCYNPSRRGDFEYRS